MGESYIPLRALNEVIYCEKLFYIMYGKGVFEESADTVEGTNHHKKRENTNRNNKVDNMNVYSLILYGYEGKLSAKLDGVIKEADHYIPIEDKNSKIPESEYDSTLWGFNVSTKIWINDFAQIVGQMYLLRYNNFSCNKGRVYYRGSNTILEVEWKDEYENMIESGVDYCLKLLQDDEPTCLVDSEKCIRCSLNWACLPDEINTLNKIIEEPRRLYPGRPDGGTLYVTKIGSKVGKSGQSFSVNTPDEEKISIPIKDVENICLYGNTQITTQAMTEVITNGGGVFYFSSGGWINGCTHAPLTKNVQLRIAQYNKLQNIDICLHLVQNNIISKISNQRTMIRRNNKGKVDDILDELKREKEKIRITTNIDSIRGYEGNSARLYWQGYASLIKESDKWKMVGRNRRPPKDEINAMLSFGYSLLLRDFISAIVMTGMDYLLGFYHIVQPGRPSLALDLMEPYRPLLVDSIVLRMVNENMVDTSDFMKTKAGVYMKPETKKKIIYMYEKRVDEMITHPKFGYRLSYRRMINLEAKLFGKYIQGEIDDYIPLMTR